jgi:hypothetical protein
VRGRLRFARGQDDDHFGKTLGFADPSNFSRAFRAVDWRGAK